jgi:transcriptional regulator with XRE-family HTH domain
MTFADQIQAIIDRPGWTRQRLGAEIGASQPTISRWIKGQVLPGRAHEQRLCELQRSLGADTGPTALERLGAALPRPRDLTSLVRFEWSGRLSPAAAAKVASIIADDMSDRAFRWQPVEAAS